MKGKRYTEEQIIGILKAHEAGTKVAELERKHGISEQSFYRWKSKFGGMEVSEARRLQPREVNCARCLVTNHHPGTDPVHYVSGSAP